MKSLTILKPILIFFLVVVLIIIAKVYIINNTSTVVEVIVTDKERVTYQYGKTVQSKYLIFTKTETFECTDEFLKGKWNSSDLYGQIEKGEKYKFNVYGYRVPFLSMYRNIVMVHSVK